MDSKKVIEEFKLDNWLDSAKAYVTNATKLKSLVECAKDFIKKKGLASVKGQMSLLLSYIKDVAVGKYKDYNVLQLTLIVAGVVYVVTPIDLIPDFVPVAGWADDVAVIAYVFKTAHDELVKYSEWQAKQSVEDGPNVVSGLEKKSGTDLNA